ncbi:MAG: hypothetical protein ACLPWF_04670 [Bryobacteraceae bacterium]|jgi:hypothetical protein
MANLNLTAADARMLRQARIVDPRADGWSERGMNELLEAVEGAMEESERMTEGERVKLERDALAVVLERAEREKRRRERRIWLLAWASWLVGVALVSMALWKGWRHA